MGNQTVDGPHWL